MHKLIRITTVPLSLEKLLEGQLTYMDQYFEVVAVSAEKERLEKFGQENGVKTFWVDMTRSITPFTDLKAVYKLYRFLKKEKPIIVHTHTPKAGIVGMMAAKMAGVPLRLHTVAGLPLLESTGLKRKILNSVEQMTYRFATNIYPNSFNLAQIIRELNFTSDEKIKVLGKGSSNGIDTSYFNPEIFNEDEKSQLRKQTGIPNGDFVFLFVGRLVTEKGINELVTAFKNLQLKYSSISLLLVGPFEEDLDPLHPTTIKEIKNNNKIFTTGYQIDVRPFFAISNALTFPSYREGFPNVVLQAGAMGLPAVVTNINGCNEIIENKKNGLIVPAKNILLLKEAMDTLVRDQTLTQNLAEHSRRAIVENYERSSFWEILKKEYEMLLRQHTKQD